MADKKDKEKKKSKTTKADLILILVLALILALCVGAFYVVPDIVKGKNPLKILFHKMFAQEAEENEEEVDKGPMIGLVGEVLEEYEADGNSEGDNEAKDSANSSDDSAAESADKGDARQSAEQQDNEPVKQVTAQDNGNTQETSSGNETQQNALRAAKSYLDFMAFSYSGLLKQLEFDKYPTEDAKYAVDNCGADWNEQAAKSAKSYLDTMAFSRDGLIDQLVFDGYTNEQAEYGADSVGL